MSSIALFGASNAHAGYSAIMVDADNGNVLHEVDATRPWYPASLTKVMTLYMTFDAIRNGRIGLYDRMYASYHAARQPQSKLGLRAGESLSVEDAILALITRSANDAAVVLAEHIAGSEENFAARMTSKARQLGMYSTRFMNATGLPNSLQVTTSRDLALLAWKIMRHFPNYYPYFASHTFYFKGRELRGINKFTASYPGAEGMKTGYTCGSGYNLISTAVQNGKRLIGVVLGGMSSAQRYQLMTNMMDGGFANRYGYGSYRNVSTMTGSRGGLPPYQLNCGKGRSVAYDEPSPSYRAAPRPKHRIAPIHPRSHERYFAKHSVERPRRADPRGYHRPARTSARAGYHRPRAAKAAAGRAAYKRAATGSAHVASKGAARVAKKTVAVKGRKSSVAQRAEKRRNKNS